MPVLKTALVLLALAPVAWGEELATLLLKHYRDRVPVAAVAAPPTLEQGRAVQQALVAALGKDLGPVVGYKAGLTNPAVQQRFGVDRPIRGSLLAGMLLESPAELPAAFGAVPMTEGDLLVRVGSEAINTAASPEQALAALEAVIPFLELPDLVLGKAVQADAGLLTAVNVGARYGVMGKPITLAATADWRERLGRFRLLILDEDGNTLAEGDGSALLGHPLSVVLWLRDSLAAEGRRLQPGDLLSLGSVTPLMPARPGATVRARYLGLDPAGPVEVRVRFR